MLVVAGLIGCVSLFYATVGQAGGTAFLAVMAFAEFPAGEMRATALMRYAERKRAWYFGIPWVNGRSRA